MRKNGLLALGQFKSVELVLRALSDYHAHSVVGVEHLPRTGNGIVVATHSLATYDAIFLGLVAYDRLGRIFHTIGDRRLLSMPFLGPAFRELGFTEGSRKEALEVLRRGDLMAVVPGGMREALRSSHEKYRVDWRGRTGFVWASCRSGAPIILAACPRADDVFDVADVALTRRLYDRFKVPVPIFRGLGPTPVPRPIKLTHLLSEPIFPTVPPDQVTPEYVESHHAFLQRRMTELISDALRLDDPPATD